MNKHFQMRRNSSLRFFTPYASVIRFGNKEIKYVSACQIDRFFEQPQNLTSEGWLDTSPMAASTPSAEAHVMSVEAKKYSSQLPVEDLFGTTVSKTCQTLSEVSQLTKSIQRPVKEDFEDIESVESVPTPVPAPVTE